MAVNLSIQVFFALAFKKTIAGHDWFQSLSFLAFFVLILTCFDWILFKMSAGQLVIRNDALIWRAGFRKQITVPFSQIAQVGWDRFGSGVWLTMTNGAIEGIPPNTWKKSHYGMTAMAVGSLVQRRWSTYSAQRSTPSGANVTEQASLEIKHT
jgi:hypothetical protein